MNSRSSLFQFVLALALSAAVTGSVGCERNMGSGKENEGWTKVETGTQAPQALPKADAVNVTYFYLPG